MSDRDATAQRIHELHEARIRGDVAAMCRLFAEDATLRIAGSSDGKPIEIAAQGVAEIKVWFSMMVRTSRLRDYELVSLMVDGPRAAAHWHVDVHSRITGQVVPTELVDLIELKAGRIVRYTELFTLR
jgi:ketosteroid isomerase-like protein